MKIKTNAKIQKAVDARKGSDITQFAAAHIVATSFVDDVGDEDFAVEDVVKGHVNGVTVGLYLAERYQQARESLVREAHLGGDSVPKEFGIYVATQATHDGDDHIYFIGTPDTILAKLKTIDPIE